jgi:hypothetical protein
MSPRVRIGCRRLLAVGVACALAAGFGVSVTAAARANARAPQQRSEPPVDELLERFPLGEETVADAPKTTPRKTAPPPAVTVPVEPPVSESDRPWLFTAAGVVALLVAIGAGSLLVRRARRRPAWTIPNLAALHPRLALSDEECNKVQPAVNPTRRSPIVSEATQDLNKQTAESDQGQATPAGAHDSETAQQSEHGGVVERVSAILQAAEAAAAAIREEAKVGASEIQRQAEGKGRAHLEQVTKDGQAYLAQVKEEAARIRNDAVEAANEAQSGAEAYGAKQRREAAQAVKQTLAQAEAQARATRQAAEEMARQIESAAREREETLRAQMRPLETSLRRALDAFRGISAQLEELLDSVGPEDETLVGALSDTVRKTGDREETAPQQQARSNG